MTAPTEHEPQPAGSVSSVPPTQVDTIYRDPATRISDFAFDDSVAAVFSDMIRRSVPAYETVIPVTGLLAARNYQAGTRIYDLGCSLGASTLAVLRQLADTPAEIVAVDNSAAMIKRARQHIGDSRVRFVREDLRRTPIDNASVVLMNFTLQFVPPEAREATLRHIVRGLVPGGALIMSEKVRLDDPDEQRFLEDSHAAFKAANGYSDLEIASKRTALENVMIVDTPQAHRARLQACGFKRTHQWFQCLNWASYIAWA